MTDLFPTLSSFLSPQSISTSTADCKKPRKNRSAYTLFSLEIKPKIKASSDCKLSCADLQTSVSQLWKDLSDEERKKYTDQANEEKLHYMLKLKKFYETASPETIQEATKPKPKRPYSAYCYFVKEMKGMIHVPDAKFKMQEVLKQASEKWRALSEEERAVYYEKARLAKENYSTETSDTAESMKVEEDSESAESIFEQKPIKKVQEKKMSGTNKKRGLNFSKDVKEKMEELEKQNICKKVKTEILSEGKLNAGCSIEKAKSQSSETTLAGCLIKNPAQEIEVKKESMLEEMLRPIPIKIQQSQSDSNFGLQIPSLNQNLNMVEELRLAMGIEYARRCMINQLVMRNFMQMIPQDNVNLRGNDIQVKAENF